MFAISRSQLTARWRRWTRTAHIETRALLAIALMGVLALTSGCGGGGGGSSPTPDPSGNTPDQGELIIGITDAPGDFIAYTVTLESLTLTRSNGDTVQTLPLETRIDFTELTELTEFLTVATVPAGTYESATVRLNFDGAEILVQDPDGNAIAADAQDAEGNELAQIDMDLRLAESDVIRIRPGAPAAFSLDFDLDASNEIDLTTTPPIVTVEPLLLATPELETDREHRVRGVLDGVDVAANQFDLLVRPFRHRTGQFGEFTVNVDEDTQYEIDGVGYTGLPGLQAMETLAERAPVITSGRIEAGGLVAEIVLAGSSVPWNDADVVRGIVVARADNELTVRGAAIESADGRRIFRGTHTVLLTSDTTVSAPGGGEKNTQSISVGQPVLAWGEATDDTTLTAARVRMAHARLTGAVQQAEPLVVDLYWLNSRRPEIYDFTGTGITAEDDADADFYEINTGLLSLGSIEQGDLVRARGLVNEFGAAPADFIARTLIDVQTDLRAAHLSVGWPEGTAEPFASVAPERVDVDLSEARKALKMRGVPMGFIELLDEVALTAPDSGRGVYAVKVRGAGEAHLFRNFEDLVDELIAQLDNGRLLHRIIAHGRYNTDTAELITRRAGFIFSAAEDSE